MEDRRESGCDSYDVKPQRGSQPRREI